MQRLWRRLARQKASRFIRLSRQDPLACLEREPFRIRPRNRPKERAAGGRRVRVRYRGDRFARTGCRRPPHGNGAVSSILDALRRRPDDRSDDQDKPKNVRTDAVLATLGYPRSARRAGLSTRTMLL